MAEPSGSSEALAAGPAIARTIELSARLTILTARTVGRADLAQRARSVGELAAPLAAEDAAAYREFLDTHSEESRQRTIARLVLSLTTLGGRGVDDDLVGRDA